MNFDSRSNQAGKRVLLTGVNGFLGKHVAKALLDAEAIPLGLVRHSADLTELKDMGILNQVTLLTMNDDFSNVSQLVSDSRPDIVIHMASASRVKEDANGVREMINANILFPSLLLDSTANVGVRRFINVGTSWQSCDGTRYKPFNFYAATKQSIEDIAEHYVSLGVNISTLRLFDTYGADDPRSKILNLIIRHTLNGQPLDMSPGQQKIHLVHISDVARALLTLASRPNNGDAAVHEKYDLISDQAISLRELAEKIEIFTGQKCPINWGGRPYRTHEIMSPIASNPEIPDFILRKTLDNELPAVISVQKNKISQGKHV